MASRKVYLNKKQDAFLHAPQNTKVWIGGRGSGKTVNCGDHLYDYILNLPRLKGFLLGKTFGQVYDKFLPEILNRLNAYGLREHIDNNTPGHYVVCKQPPKYFQKPYKMPRRYDTSVFFITGFYLELLSFDRPDISRGGSYDIGIHDEAALIKQEKYNKAIAALVRGTVRKNDHPQRFTRLFYTSRSWTSWGRWVETEFKRLAAEQPEDYYYMETSALDNVDALGEKYFKRNQDLLSPQEYDVEILNLPVDGVSNGFYPFYSDSKHLLELGEDYQNQYREVNGVWRMQEGSLHPDKAIEPSFDFNNAFASATVFQDHTEELNEFWGINEFWVKNDTLDSLVDKICNHYKAHPTKVAKIYGGKDGETSKILLGEIDFYTMIVERFKHNGWHAFINTDFYWSDKQHKLKYEIMNSVLKENDPTVPRVRFHQENCKYTYTSMKNAPALAGYRKDKSSEADEHLPQELATHLSDNVDNYIIPKVKGQIVPSQSNTSPSAGSF